MQRAALNRWTEHRNAGERVVMLAVTNDTVHALNDAAQSIRIRAGDLHRDRSVQGRACRVHVGDEVVTRANDRTLRTDQGVMVRNRAPWTVTGIGVDGSVTARNADGTVRLPAGLRVNVGGARLRPDRARRPRRHRRPQPADRRRAHQRARPLRRSDPRYRTATTPTSPSTPTTPAETSSTPPSSPTGPTPPPSRSAPNSPPDPSPPSPPASATTPRHVLRSSSCAPSTANTAPYAPSISRPMTSGCSGSSPTTALTVNSYSTLTANATRSPASSPPSPPNGPCFPPSATDTNAATSTTASHNSISNASRPAETYPALEHRIAERAPELTVERRWAVDHDGLGARQRHLEHALTPRRWRPRARRRTRPAPVPHRHARARP